MKDTDCENVLTAKMAEADGEVSALPSEEIDHHIRTCENCRIEVDQLRDTDNLFRRVSRKDHAVDLWPTVSQHLLNHQSTSNAWKPFAITAALLLGYKLFELLPAEDPGVGFKVLPLIVFVALIVVIKENPFRINTELVLEK